MLFTLTSLPTEAPADTRANSDLEKDILILRVPLKEEAIIEGTPVLRVPMKNSPYTTCFRNAWDGR